MGGESGLEYIISIFLLMCEAIAAIRLNLTWLKWRFDKIAWYFLVPLIALLWMLPGQLIGDAMLRMAVGFLFMLATACIFFKGSLVLKILLTFCCMILIGSIDYSSAYLVCWVQQISYSEDLASVQYYMISALLSKLLLIVTTHLIYNAFKTTRNRHKTLLQWIQMLLYPGVCVVVVMLSLKNLYFQDEPSTGFVLLMLALIVATLLQLILLEKVDQDAAAHYQNQLLSQQLNLQTANARELADAYENQRRNTHDFINHLLALDALTESQPEQARQYIRRLIGSCRRNTPVFTTGNAVADALLNTHYAKAIRNGIHMTVHPCDLSVLRLPDEAIAVILGNLLDNAQEACAKCPAEAEINVIFKIIDNDWAITIANSCPDNTQVGRETTKADKKLHGYGLRNVAAVLNANGGAMQNQVHDGHYIVHIRIPVTPDGSL